MRKQTQKILDEVKLTATDIDMMVRREANTRNINIPVAERIIAQRFRPYGMSLEDVRLARKAARQVTA